jgi:thiol-disulfide isomerase/thioredoxin
VRVFALLPLFVIFTAAAAETKPPADPVRVPTGILIRDVRGQVQRPFFAEPGKVAVVFFVTNDCPVSNGYAQEIRRICEAYDGKAKCTLNYVDPTLTPATVIGHLSEYNHGSYPAVIDTDHELVKASGAQVTPEVVVVRPGGEIAYRGRIDNKYESIGRARQQPTVHDLRDVLDAVLAGKPVAAARTTPIGCYITPLEFFKNRKK